MSMKDKINYSKIQKYYLTRYSNYRVINNTYYETVNKIDIVTTSSDKSIVITPGMSSRLDILANNFYGNPNYYWIIAMANEIVDPLAPLEIGRVIKIPSMSSVVKAVGGL